MINMVKHLSLYDLMKYKQKYCIGCSTKRTGLCDNSTAEALQDCFANRCYVYPELLKQLDDKGRLSWDKKENRR